MGTHLKGRANKMTKAEQLENVYGIIIEKNLIQRLFGMVRIKLIYMKDEAELYPDLLFPTIKETRAKQILQKTVPTFKLQEELHSLPKQALFMNLIQPSYFLVIVTFFVFFFWPEYWLIPFIFFLFTVGIRITKTYQTKYRKTDEMIQFQTGVLSIKTFITTRGKINEFEVYQSWLQKNLGVATIHITIGASTKSTHLLRMEHLPVETAIKYVDWFKGAQSENTKVNHHKKLDA